MPSSESPSQVGQPGIPAPSLPSAATLQPDVPPMIPGVRPRQPLYSHRSLTIRSGSRTLSFWIGPGIVTASTTRIIGLIEPTRTTRPTPPSRGCTDSDDCNGCDDCNHRTHRISCIICAGGTGYNDCKEGNDCEDVEQQGRVILIVRDTQYVMAVLIGLPATLAAPVRDFRSVQPALIASLVSVIHCVLVVRIMLNARKKPALPVR